MPGGSEFAERRPHPVLRPYVVRYVGYRQHDVTLAVHRGLPSPYVTLVVSLAEPVRVVQPHARLQALVGGLQTSSVLIQQDPYQCGVQLELNPLGVRALLGVSAAELSGAVVDLADLQRPALAQLPERLYAAPGWPQRFAVLDQVLAAAVAGAGEVPPEVRWAWRRMIHDGGRGAVSELAAEVGWSRRHFGERFRAEVGLAPKQAARVVRFERASAALRDEPRRPLAELAADCGYYDQAHLTNEWQAMAGCTPSTWVAEELPFLQSDPAAEAAVT